MTAFITETLPKVIESLISITGLEWLAMLLSLAYVVLAARGSLWCWPAAFISTALYTYIFYEYLLLMDSALNAYYLAMAVYGFWIWRKSTPPATDAPALNTADSSVQNNIEQNFTVMSWHINWHIKACSILAVVSIGLGYVMANYTDADFAYLDTFTTVYAVFATYLIAQKVLENWIYWIVIDLVSIYLYLQKALYPTALLFIIFTCVAFYGYAKWRKLLKSEQKTIQSTNDGSFA
ncbi:nicotinamide riboside transporter PnuC [Colwellia sp. D2M02]|uniref:nicotinamide riboside transporter PnuC n=1 Tax=Colwellia sp. D2M02 TaxID=2841562 RepID=UPI001C08C069|nr:nicotinamide riboside transporter PnuC [Colwellia sp. D2M02]MBU2891700.1 nicotinamide riboside transporter PnuC [Colwellia sp. D2M02]